jgi:Flp pilus assembly protein TadB
MDSRLQYAEDGSLERAPKRPPILRRVAAALILVAAAAIVIHFVIGLLMTVFYIALIAGVVIAAIWALKTIVW